MPLLSSGELRPRLWTYLRGQRTPVSGAGWIGTFETRQTCPAAGRRRAADLTCWMNGRASLRYSDLCSSAPVGETLPDAAPPRDAQTRQPGGDQHQAARLRHGWWRDWFPQEGMVQASAGGPACPADDVAARVNAESLGRSKTRGKKRIQVDHAGGSPHPQQGVVIAAGECAMAKANLLAARDVMGF